jgi:hypothetical protein
LLGKPDRLAVNPHYRSGPKVQLFDRERAVAAERDPTWLAYQEKRAVRSVAATKAAETQRQALMEQIELMKIDVMRLPVERIMAESLASWRDWQTNRGNSLADGGLAPDDVRRRWALNYIRHELTRYDRYLVPVHKL